MKFEPTYQGRVYSMTSGVLYQFDGQLYGSAVDGQSVRVALTGYSVTSQKGTVAYQTTSGYYIVLSEGWIQVGVAPIAKYSESQAQALVNKIIRNNKTIICNNLLCARYANRFSESERAEIRGLQSRLQARNSALQAEGLTKDVQKQYPEGYAELSSYLDALMAGETIGVATWVIIVVACVVIAGMGTAAYFAYKSLADESEKDVKFSKELTATLVAKLTPEEYEQLKAETKDIVTKARIKQSLGSYWNVLKWVAIAFAGYTAYKMIMQQR